jgi:molybdopterin/thiamine biosynthesis adenylyltransferase/rhodanese-related sulfurtransferase
MTDSSASIQSIEANRANFDLVLDIRPHAGSTPTVSGAVAVTADRLLSNPSQFIGSNDDLVLVVCDIGLRSAIVTDQLRSIGYGSAISLEGGIESWIAAGLPITSPQGLSIDDYARYDRQLKLPGFGIPGQQALASARVAIVGVGGLGSPVLGYLAAAGVGHLTIIDSDNVELSNLHRQPIYTTGDVGRAKSEAAASYAAALNPTIEITASTTRIDPSNAEAVLRGHDVLVTCTDSFDTAHAINGAAVLLGIPMVFGSVYRTEGQLAVFDARSGPCYACVFPAQSTDPGLDCSIVGVLGPVTGVIGSMQATETIKVVIGSSSTNTGVLVLYDAESQSIDTLTLHKVASCTTCSDSQVPSIRV